MHAKLTAALIMLSGIALVFCSFFTPPKGSVDETVLMYFTETLVWGGGAFGFGEFVLKILDYLRGKKKS